MKAWTLVLPTDLTPAEQRWFREELAAEVSVPVDWMGRIALEAAFAERPDLARHLLPGSAERLALEMLVQANQESAALAGGIPDAITRGANLRDLVRRVDPDWDFDLDLHADGTTVVAQPKDDDAISRSPLFSGLRLSAPPDSPQARAINAFFTYGTPLHLDGQHATLHDVRLPGGLADLIGDNPQLQSVSITSAPASPQRVQLVGICSGRVVNRLAVQLTEATQGPRGGQRLALSDDAGILSVELLVDPGGGPRPRGGFAFKVEMRPDLHPHDAIPAIAFLVDLRRCDGIRLDRPGEPPVQVRLLDATSAEALAPVAGLLAQLQALARVQDATGVSLGVPVLNEHDQQMLYFADRLLAEGHVRWYWPGFIYRIPTAQVRELLARATGLIPTININGSGQKAIDIAGHAIQLGNISMEVTNAVIVNAHALHKALNQDNPPGYLDVHIQAHAATVVTFSLEPVTRESADEPMQ